MRQAGSDLYDLVSVFFLALGAFMCIITLLIMGGVVTAGPFEPEDPTATPTRLAAATFTPSPMTPTQTPEPATATYTITPTWTDFPTNTALPSTTPSQTQTPTITLTWTPSSTPSQTEIPSSPTEAPTITNTPSITPTEGPSPTATITVAPFPLTVQQGMPLFRDAYLHPGCEWQGVAGQVTLLGGAPGLGYVIQVTGDGISGSLTQVSGTNTNFGAAGWEIKVADGVTSGRYQVQVLSADGTQQLSPVVELAFNSDCEQNLALINFVQVRPF